jgi:hypothetical protein
MVIVFCFVFFLTCCQFYGAKYETKKNSRAKKQADDESAETSGRAPDRERELLKLNKPHGE